MAIKVDSDPPVSELYCKATNKARKHHDLPRPVPPHTQQDEQYEMDDVKRQGVNVPEIHAGDRNPRPRCRRCRPLPPLLGNESLPKPGGTHRTPGQPVRGGSPL
jgi:hypothetical protein